MKTLQKILLLASACFWAMISWLPVYADAFKIQDVEVIEADIIDVQFTRELDTELTAVREFILEEEDTAIEIEILLSEVVQSDTTKVTLMLDQFLKENTNYTITVLDIKDSEGNTIEAWIDSVFTFNTWIMTIADSLESQESDTVNEPHETLSEDNTQQMTLSGSSIEDESTEMDLNAAAEIPTADRSGMAGTTSHADEISSSGVLIHAEENTDLPETGPEIALLLLLALIAGWCYTYSKTTRV